MAIIQNIKELLKNYKQEDFLFTKFSLVMDILYFIRCNICTYKKLKRNRHQFIIQPAFSLGNEKMPKIS
jgi:hypothetical protein